MTIDGQGEAKRLGMIEVIHYFVFCDCINVLSRHKKSPNEAKSFGLFGLSQ